VISRGRDIFDQMSSPVSCRGAGLTILRGGAGQVFTADFFRFHMLLNEKLDARGVRRIDLRGGVGASSHR
jgi:hypothetical protein